MTQPFVLLTVALVAGAAAAVAPGSPRAAVPTPAKAAVAPATTKGVVARSPADQADWLARFGTYDVRKGTWNVAPSEPRGC